MDRSENKSTIDRFLNHLLRLRPCVSGDPIRSVPLRSPWHQRGPRRTQSWSAVLSRWTLMTSMYCYKVSSYTCFGYFILLCSQMDYQRFRHLQHTQENWIFCADGFVHLCFVSSLTLELLGARPACYRETASLEPRALKKANRRIWFDTVSNADLLLFCLNAK